jgi:hypothetical protein
MKPGFAKHHAAEAIRLLTSSDARSELTTRMLHRDVIHQDVTLSWEDRYPHLFTATAELLSDKARPRLLSFGCSAGEEVLSLKRAMPAATIVGAEINRAKLRACRRLPPDPDICFLNPTSDSIAARGPYDAIFCMAVLTRRPHEVEQRMLKDISVFYPHERFRAQLDAFVQMLHPGGLLVVEHSLYRVEDVAPEFSLEPVGGVWPAKGPRFDRLGTLIAGRPMIARIWRKAA